MALGSVTLGRATKADGKDLAAGTYQVRLTSQNATPEAKGETTSAARWEEYVRGGKVVGREVVESHGGTLVLIPFVTGRSTTDILHRIQHGNHEST